MLVVRNTGSIIAAALATTMTLTVAYPTSAAALDAADASATAASVTAVTGTRDLVRSATADSNSAAIVTTRAGSVDIPTSTRGQVSTSAGQFEVSVGLPDLTEKPAVRDASGTVVYADRSQPADVAVQPLTSGFRALVSIKDANAPREYRFPVDGPEGSRLTSSAELFGAEFDTGEVFLLDAADRVITGFEAPWAKDANGAPVTTRYRLEGNTLVQVVDFDQNTAFPVLADPNFWQVTRCAAAVAWFVGTNIIAPLRLLKVKRYIQSLGGLRASANLMLRASTWVERINIGGGALVGLAAEIAGVAAIQDNC